MRPDRFPKQKNPGIAAGALVSGGNATIIGTPQQCRAYLTGGGPAQEGPPTLTGFS